MLTWVIGIVYADTTQLSEHQTINDLLIQAELQRRAGRLYEAEANLHKALGTATRQANNKAETLASGMLGNLYLQQYRYVRAKPLLDQVWQDAQQSHWPALQALFGNFLGNYYYGQKNWVEAKLYYDMAFAAASRVKDTALAVQIQLNLARLAIAMRQLDQGWILLNELKPALHLVEPISERLAITIETAYLLLKLVQHSFKYQSQATERAYKTLNEALTLAEKIEDQRSLSLSLGYLGQLYEGRKRYADALIYTDRAAHLAQAIDARELLLQWEWQRGRLLTEMAHPKEALQAYRRSVDTIETIRQDIPVTYHQGRSSFRETLEPVYLGLAGLLLREATQAQDSAEKKQLLLEVRQTVERIKQTELEDYFQNRCVIHTVPEVNLEAIAPDTATVYPVLLNDRLEIVVGIGDALYHRSVLVPAEQVRQNVHSLAHKLRRRKPGFEDASSQLYQWLVGPIAGLLSEHRIKTLVIVPDRGLRQIPFAALFDGSAYLVERYALVTSPGLTLFDPRPNRQSDLDALFAGVSQPGPVVKSLPIANLQGLVTVLAIQSGVMPEDKKQRTPAGSQYTALTEEEIRSMLENQEILEKTQQALALPGVKKEIDILSELFPSTVLMDEQFSSSQLNDSVLESPFRVVHIASHGYFGQSSEQSYIMTYDQIVTLDQLESLLYSDKFGETPIELLTLSACQTAEGDDRAPLGLSGVALKAKVRSVLGALWPVSDQATVKLMQVFYEKLKTPGITKAQALQAAQITLLQERKYRHPFFWSPFILIGNWL